MHKSLFKSDEFEISWLEGSRCVLAVAQESVQGFRGVSMFFSKLRESRSQTKAHSWLLDLRHIRKIPDELWKWVDTSWYPQLVGEGLGRQALLLPDSRSARPQWNGIRTPGLVSRHFEGLPRAIMWLSEDLHHPLPGKRKEQMRVVGAQ